MQGGYAWATRWLSTLLLAVGLGGCISQDVNQSILNPAGRAAEEIEELWWLLFVVCTAVYVLVVGLLLGGIFRRRAREGEPPRPVSTFLWLGLGGVALPIVALAVFLFFTLRVTMSESQALASADDMAIKVIGHRWWWEISYQHREPQRQLTTANEIYVPVGRTVRIELESRDIIHSFWVPALQGKIDLIPGRINAIAIHADRPGVYRGQCGEYCGQQHANMALIVVAVPQEEFETWYEGQLQEAETPESPLAREGMRVFLEKPCAVCHAVRGTLALGSAGPDLTHLASRRTIAAGTLPNTRGHLGGWISNPQSIKPGNLMPNVDMTAEEFLAVLAYLETLK